MRTIAFNTCFAAMCLGNHPYRGSCCPRDLDEPAPATGGAFVYGFAILAIFVVDSDIGGDQ